MVLKRIEFSDRQKAEIYVRDRATCCFSGANLWLLDAPLRPGYECDWADHILPSARGGGSDVSNGVCAGHTFNAKKRHNSADNFYLFEKGVPTVGYFEIFGTLPAHQKARSKRLSKLEIEDWFLNRTIMRVLTGFDDRCGREFYSQNYKRDSQYWFRAAYRFLLRYQKLPKTSSLERRKIVTRSSKLKQQWLELREVRSEREFLTIVDRLFPIYRRNYRDWANYFWDCETFEEFSSSYRRSKKSKSMCPSVLGAIESHFNMLKASQHRTG